MMVRQAGALVIGWRVVLAVALAGALLLSAGAYTVFGVIQNDDTTWYACLEQRSGTLYNVGESPLPCRLGHRSISWNRTGPDGAPGMSGYEFVNSEIVPVPAGGNGSRIVTCPAGKYAVGGGPSASSNPAVPYLRVVDSMPTEFQGLSAWVVTMYNSGAEQYGFTVRVACVNVAP
jgi:hypothetical protein